MAPAGTPEIRIDWLSEPSVSVSAEVMAQRILARQAAHAWLTLADGGTILGYGYYGAVYSRYAPGSRPGGEGRREK